MTQLKLVIVAVFAFIVAVFAVSNTADVSIMFFGREVISSVSLVIIVLGSVLLGVLLTAILGFLYQSRLKGEISALSRTKTQLKAKEEKLQLKIRELEEKLEENNIPIGEQPISEEKE